MTGDRGKKRWIGMTGKRAKGEGQKENNECKGAGTGKKCQSDNWLAAVMRS